MNLYRKLQAITGQTPTEFIRTIRLKRAAQLLQKKIVKNHTGGDYFHLIFGGGKR